jgi:tetratricopeptide (TPR) repeat protein
MAHSRHKNSINSARIIPVLVGLLAIASQSLAGQSEPGRISGSVKDLSGAVVARAEVTLTLEGGLIPLAKRTTQADGRFVFEGVGAGKYKVTANSSGFREASSQTLSVASKADVAVNLTLAPDAPAGGLLRAQPGASQNTSNEAGYYEHGEKKNPRQKSAAVATTSGEPGYYEHGEMKAAGVAGAVDPGGYSAPGQAERGAHLVEGAARLQKNSPTAAPGSAAGPSQPNSEKLKTIELELKKTVEAEPERFENNYNLGEFYIHTGRLAEAIPYLDKAYRLDPSHYVNAYDLALAELETEKLAAARKQLRAMIQRQDNAELHNLLAEVEEKSANYLAAAKEYELAARLEPSEKNIFDWGVELLRHQTLEPAIEIFGQGAERYPRSARIWIGFGTALYSRGKYDEAVKAFSQATDLEPADPRPYSFLAQVYNVSSLQAPGVVERLRRFAELQPKNPQALYSYALALWKAEGRENSKADLSQVESLLKRAAEIDPRFADAHLQLGILSAERKDYLRAVEEYEQAIQSNPNSADAHYRLGQALVRTGEKARAQGEFEAYERLHKQQLAGVERQRAEIQQFVYSYQEGTRP